MNLLTNERIDRNQWWELIRSCPSASCFQTPLFYDFLNSVPGFSAQAIAVEDGERVRALMVAAIHRERGIQGYFSRRGIIYGGPLLSSDDPNPLQDLLAGIEPFLRQNTIYLETRNLSNYSSYHHVFSEAGWRFVPYGNFILRLRGRSMKDILSSMEYNRKREIRLSLEEGASYEECPDDAGVQALYGILRELYDERVRRPLPSLNYFQAFFRNGVGKVFIVKHGDRIIGGSFCPVFAERAIYTLYYCGIRDYQKKIFPTHLAVLAAIDYGIRNDIPLLDFMGAGQPGIEYGVRQYKKGFGGEWVEYGRFLRINHAFQYFLGKAGLSILSRLKK